jgi:hypothetical protein
MFILSMSLISKEFAPDSDESACNPTGNARSSGARIIARVGVTTDPTTAMS